MKKQSFSLVELLVVIAILGAIAYLMLPQFGNIEDKAISTLGTINAKQVDHFISTYHSASGVYCSNFHTGLKNAAVKGTPAEPLENLPPVIQTLIDNGAATWSSIRPSCLRNEGIVSLAYGTGLDSRITLIDLNGSNALNDNDNLMALQVTGDWFVSGTSGTKITFGGHSLDELIKLAPWKKANLVQDIAHDEQFKIYALFMGPTTQTHSVFDSNGKYLGASKISIDAIKNIHNYNGTATLFTYPICFFKISKENARYLGSLSFNKTGTAFLEQ